jgi:hypothetical protein
MALGVVIRLPQVFGHLSPPLRLVAAEDHLQVVRWARRLQLVKGFLVVQESTHTHPIIRRVVEEVQVNQEATQIRHQS